MYLIAGRTSSFIALVLLTVVTLFYIWRGTVQKKIAKIRKIPGLDVIDEAVGRCLEVGRPVHYTLGLAGLSRASASQTLAGLSVLEHVSRECAKLNVDIITTICTYEVLPIAEEIVRTSYDIEGAEYRPSYVRYVGRGQGALSIAVQGIMERERPGANFMMGLFDEEAISIAEKGYRSGCIGIGGTATIGQLSILSSTMDYLLIGEELYAASAYISKDEIQTATIASIDVWKVLALAGIIVGTMLLNLGVPAIINLLSA